MNRGDIARRRMHSHRLWGTPHSAPEDALRWLGAVQSQEYPVAKWSLAQRAEGVTDGVIERRFAEGAILRIHVLRPTWHFVLREDIVWLLELTAPRVHARSAYYHRRLGLDADAFAASARALERALKGGRQLTRKELVEVLQAAGVEASGLRLGYILMHAELDGVICSGAPRGKQQTYASFEERAAGVATLDRDAALAELTRRYFRARGPATVKDYLWWSSLTAADVRRGLDMLGPELAREEIDGRTYWFAASPPVREDRSSVIDLVQGYDECIVSYTESKDVLHDMRPSLPDPQQRPAFTHAVLLDGRVVGRWRHVPRASPPAIETALDRSLALAEERALEAAVERYARFRGEPVSLR